MKKINLIALILTTLAQLTYGQVNKSYSVQGQSGFQGRGYIEKAPNGYVTTFTSYSTPFVTNLLSIDTSGNVEWAKAIELVAESDACITNQSNLYLGASISYLAPSYALEATLIKHDLSGNVIWSKIISYAKGNSCTAEIETNQNDIVLFGGLQDTIANKNGLFLSSFDSTGTTNWTRQYFHDTISIWPKQLLKTSDKGFLLSAWDDYWVSPVIIKTDSIGNMQWGMNYTDAWGTEIQHMSECANGDYILTGRADGYGTFGAGDWDICLIRLDQNGNFKYGKTYGDIDPDEGYFLYEKSPNEIIIVAEPESYYWYSQTSILKTDSLGTLESMNLIRPDSAGRFPFGAVVEDEGFLTIFGIDGGWFGEAYLTLIQTDTNLNFPCHQELVTPILDSFPTTLTMLIADSVLVLNVTDSIFNEIFYSVENSDLCKPNNISEYELGNTKIGPNPFTENTQLDFGDLPQGTYQFLLISSTGQIVKKIDNLKSQTLTLYNEGFSDGLYTYQLRQGITILRRGKIIISTAGNKKYR